MDIDHLTTSLHRINLSSPSTILPSPSPATTPSPPSSPLNTASTHKLPPSTSSNITTSITSRHTSTTPQLRRSGTTSIRPLLLTDANTILQSLFLLFLLSKTLSFSTSRTRDIFTALLHICACLSQLRAIWQLCAAAWKRDASRMSRKGAYNPYWRVACVRSVTMRLSLWVWLLMGRFFVLGVCVWGTGLWGKWGKWETAEDWQGWVWNEVKRIAEEWRVVAERSLGQMTVDERVLKDVCERVDWGMMLKESGR